MKNSNDTIGNRTREPKGINIYFNFNLVRFRYLTLSSSGLSLSHTRQLNRPL